MGNRIQVLGVEYNRLDLEGLVTSCILSTTDNQKRIILHHNLHSVYLYHKDKYFARCFEQCWLIHADGMPIVLWAMFLGKKNITRDFRITYVDFLPALLKEMNKLKLKLFFLGGEPGFGEKATEFFAKNYPNIEFHFAHGFFDAAKNSPESSEMVEKINTFQPHVTLVGMGMPRQEKWIVDHSEQINTNVFLAGGACLEYFTGTVSKPPRWLGKLSLEWLFRLVENPRRYYYRYLVEPFFLVPKFLKDVFQK